jgi:hypothetical protein
VHADSETPPPSPSQKRPQKGRHHQRGAESLSDVAGAIIQLSQSFGNPGPSTPEHWNKAIALLEDDGDFSDNKEVKVMGLFAGNMAVADTFLGIHKQKLCTSFIRSQFRDQDSEF